MFLIDTLQGTLYYVTIFFIISYLADVQIISSRTKKAYQINYLLNISKNRHPMFMGRSFGTPCVIANEAGNNIQMHM